jgi:hypothetical protein
LTSNEATSAGRGKPPTEHQFKPGRSGNPKGRRKGARNTKTIVQAIALERHSVQVDGRRQSMNTVELLISLLRQMASKGNRKANILLDRCRDAYTPEPNRQLGYAVFPETLTITEWIERYGPKESSVDGFSGYVDRPGR